MPSFLSGPRQATRPGVTGMKARDLYELLKTSFQNWNDDKVPRLGAALAYYMIFSLGPLLVIIIAVASLLFGKDAASGQINQEISQTVGPSVGRAIEDILQNANESASSGWAALIGVVTLLIGASGVFAQLQDALNTIWRVQPKPGRGWLGIIYDRFLSFVMVLGCCLILILSVVLNTTLTAVSHWWTPVVAASISVPLLQVINNLISLIVLLFLFALVYKVLPDVQLTWKDVWSGAAVTALLFTVGNYLLGLYLGRYSGVSAFGAASSLVFILLWVYYTSQIILFGAEFTRVYALQHGSGVKPCANADLVVPSDSGKKDSKY